MADIEATTVARKRKGLSQMPGVLMKFGVPLVITIGLCYMLFRDMDWCVMWQTAITECRPGWMISALVFSAFSNVIRAGRWRIQLRALGIRASLWTLTLSFFGTYAVNLVFPRLGEFWRTGWVAKKQNAKFSTVFGSMVSDRMCDTLCVALIVVLALIVSSGSMHAYFDANPQMISSLTDVVLSPYTLGGLGALALLSVWAYSRFKDSVVVRKAKELLHGLWQGFAIIVKMPNLNKWVILTIFLWLCYYIQLWMALMAFPLTAQVVLAGGWKMVLVLFVLSSVSMGVPSNGGIGPWQWAIILGLRMFSDGIPALDHAYAVTFANFVMGAQTVLLVLLGVFTFICIALMKKNNHYARRQA